MINKQVPSNVHIPLFKKCNPPNIFNTFNIFPFYPVLNCCRLLTRVLPCMFEDLDWRGFFWSSLPAGQAQEGEETESSPLAVSLINAICVSVCLKFQSDPLQPAMSCHITTLNFRISCFVQISLWLPTRRLAL